MLVNAYIAVQTRGGHKAERPFNKSMTCSTPAHTLRQRIPSRSLLQATART